MFSAFAVFVCLGYCLYTILNLSQVAAIASEVVLISVRFRSRSSVSIPRIRRGVVSSVLEFCLSGRHCKVGAKFVSEGKESKSDSKSGSDSKYGIEGLLQGGDAITDGIDNVVTVEKAVERSEPSKKSWSDHGSVAQGMVGPLVPFFISQSEYPYARCLDGSPVGGYILPPRAGPARNLPTVIPASYDGNVSSDGEQGRHVVLFLEGGGDCSTGDDCEAKTKTGRGSSRYWGEQCTHNACRNGILSTNCKTNPVFCRATLIFLKYCSQDRWIGTRKSSIPLRMFSSENAAKPVWSLDSLDLTAANTSTASSNAPGKMVGSSRGRAMAFWFSGAHIFDAAVDWLSRRGVFEETSRVLLAGSSMGAVGAFAHAETLKQKLHSKVVVKLLMMGALAPPWFAQERLFHSLGQPFVSRIWTDIGSSPNGRPFDQRCSYANCWQLYQPRVPGVCLRILRQFEKTVYVRSNRDSNRDSRVANLVGDVSPTVRRSGIHGQSDSSLSPWRCIEVAPHALFEMEVPVFVVSTLWAQVATGGWIQWNQQNSNVLMEYADSFQASLRGIFKAASEDVQKISSSPMSVTAFVPSRYAHQVFWNESIILKGLHGVSKAVSLFEEVSQWFSRAERGPPRLLMESLDVVKGTKGTDPIAASRDKGGSESEDARTGASESEVESSALRGIGMDIEASEFQREGYSHRDSVESDDIGSHKDLHRGANGGKKLDKGVHELCREASHTHGVAIEEVLDTFLTHGIVILKNFYAFGNDSILDGLREDASKIVDEYAADFHAKGWISQSSEHYNPMTFAEKYAAIYKDNIKIRGKSDFPTFFRAETHRVQTGRGFHRFIMGSKLRSVIGCILGTSRLRLYPVYMLRAKAPDLLSGGSQTVDWHQDAQYTFYWYSDRFSTEQVMDDYASSIVNTWVPLDDVPEELGPVQFAKPSLGCLRMTKADFIGGSSTVANVALNVTLNVSSVSSTLTPSMSASSRSALRVSEIDEYIRERETLFTPRVSGGDIILFNQYVYHRGLPNRSYNKTRWSLDFRFQRADHVTLRGERGFLLQEKQEGEEGEPVYALDQWQNVAPSARFFQLNKRKVRDYVDSDPNVLARQHVHGHSFLGAEEHRKICYHDHQIQD